jgi:hypothetical protein
MKQGPESSILNKKELVMKLDKTLRALNVTQLIMYPNDEDLYGNVIALNKDDEKLYGDNLFNPGPDGFTTLANILKNLHTHTVNQAVDTKTTEDIKLASRPRNNC